MFPKQDRRTRKGGNQVFLPLFGLGRYGRSAFLYPESGEPATDQLGFLLNMRCTDPEVLERASAEDCACTAHSSGLHKKPRTGNKTRGGKRGRTLGSVERKTVVTACKAAGLITAEEADHALACPSDELAIHCPNLDHPDSKKSASVSLVEPGRPWTCHGCGDSGTFNELKPQLKVLVEERRQLQQLRHYQRETIAGTLRAIRENVGGAVALMAEAALSVIATLLINADGGVVSLVFMGASGSSKSTCLSLFDGKDLEAVFYNVDTFTPASFVSHSARASRSKLEEIDLLPRIRHKCLVVSDLAPTFSMREDRLREYIGILTRVLDGQGLMRHTGAHGRRGYEGDYRFAWLAATTPLPPRAWALMGQMGSRLLFLEAPEDFKPESAVRSLCSSVPFGKKTDNCRKSVGNLLKTMWDQHGGYGAVKWDQTQDDVVAIEKAVLLAEFAAAARGRVGRVGVGNGQRKPGKPLKEVPHRLAGLLATLARGHALLYGRSHVTMASLGLVMEVALCSMPGDRRAFLRAVLEAKGGVLEHGQAGRILEVGHSQISALGETLSLLGVVEMTPKGFRLASQFERLLDSDLQGVWREFKHVCE